MDTPSIVAILRDMEAGKRNVLGDHWHSSHCGTAAAMLEKLDAENKQLREEIEGLHQDLAGADI